MGEWERGSGGGGLHVGGLHVGRLKVEGRCNYRRARSLRIAVTGQTADWRAKVFPVTGGAAYRLCGWFKGSGGAECFLTIRFWSDAGGSQFVGESNIPLDGSYAAWTEKKATFFAPAGAVSADVMLRCPANTTVHLYGDDFAVSPA